MSEERFSQFDIEAAKRLPELIRFGTSTWTYPGWRNLIYYENYKNEREFKALSLREYAECPLFRTVGIDSFFYKPPTPELLARYAKLIPSDFRWVSKVWEHITTPAFPAHPRYGKLSNTKNENFLNAELFSRKVIAGFTNENIKRHTGPFVFQFPAFNKSLIQSGEFLSRLDKFLSQIPKEFMYGLEVRNGELLTQEYCDLLNKHGVTHCFNHWNSMPPLRAQMEWAAKCGGLKAEFVVSRILTPLGVSYENAVKLFQPYETIKRPNPEMRRDVITMVRRAITRGIPAYVIVNNRAEGNSPMTIDYLVRKLTTGGD